MNKKLRIAQVAPLWYPVPPVGYGGTELVVSHLTEGLVKLGHSVTLFASGDSHTSAKLVSVVHRNLRELKVPWLHESYNFLNLSEAFSQSKNFDIVHTHIDPYDIIFRSFNPSIPSIATLHNPFWPKPNDPKKNKYFQTFHGRVLLYNHFPKFPYVAISESYKKQCPAKINFAKTIYHGVDLSKLPFNSQGGEHFIWIGRISPTKGVQVAVKIAKELDLKLLISGVIVNPEARDFFRRQIKPYLSSKIQFLGEIKSEKEKAEFYGRAKAFFYPLQWEEPFGLTMIEAQACGTPVISFNRGSVPEVVKNGKTGFVVEDLESFKKAIKKIGQIKREDCRSWVEENFTVEKMCQNYESLYYQIIKTWPKN